MFIYTMEYYAATKKNEPVPLAERWTGRDRHTEWSESHRKGGGSDDVPYMRKPERYK